ncbi:MAG TPA: ATP-binding cassette domain-containing protein [Kofleriaceae bacterium]|nr:ATP-binding cassette domain-containing protein [Kofleriaceae bacterium]
MSDARISIPEARISAGDVRVTMPGTESGPLLECVDVAVGYEKPVLQHANIQIGRGEIVALLGGSGCGKSTLLRTLVGLVPPLAGQVMLFGQSMYELEPNARDKLRKRIGIAFQQDALFSSMTIEDNVALPLRELTKLPGDIIKEMVRMRLALVGIAELGRRLPANISGGQRKRAALARASILDPELIFCDEPTAGLDPVVAAEVDATLVKFRDALGSSIVLVSHELESIRATANRGIMLARGAVAAIGTIDELTHSRDEAVHQFFHARNE